MAKLLYSAIASLDGYVADADGSFDWAMPSEEVHAFVNDLERPVGTYLYGRRMYEVMTYWESPGDLAEQPSIVRDFAEIWQAAAKVVYSTTLETVSTARTRLERRFDPDAVREMKASAERDLSVGGPTLAAHAFRAGLVDECHLFVGPGDGHFHACQTIANPMTVARVMTRASPPNPPSLVCPTTSEPYANAASRPTTPFTQRSSASFKTIARRAMAHGTIQKIANWTWTPKLPRSMPSTVPDLTLSIEPGSTR
jgi:dihydrofolate reductase